MGAVTAELAARQMEHVIYEGVGAWPAPANDNDAAPATKPMHEHRKPYAWYAEGGQRVPMYDAVPADLATTTVAPLASLLSRPAHRRRLVILESPYAGDVERNVAYARACVHDSLMRGEAPIASHLLYTQEGVLDDNLPEERILGIDAGLAWRLAADASVVYTDLGMSSGMRYGVQRAHESGTFVEYRTIGWGE
jgi:hypothetical protein